MSNTLPDRGHHERHPKQLHGIVREVNLARKGIRGNAIYELDVAAELKGLVMQQRLEQQPDVMQRVGANAVGSVQQDTVRTQRGVAQSILDEPETANRYSWNNFAPSGEPDGAAE